MFDAHFPDLTMLAPSLGVLTAMITPAILILAAGTLITSTSNRLGRVVDRVRTLSESFEALETGDPKTAFVEERRRHIFNQLDGLTSRARLLQLSMTSYYLALAAFVATSVIIGLLAFVTPEKAAVALHPGGGGAHGHVLPLHEQHPADLRGAAGDDRRDRRDVLHHHPRPAPRPHRVDRGPRSRSNDVDADQSAVELAHAGAAALLVGLAACSSKNDDDGGNDNPNGPSGGSNTVYYSAISASDGTGFGSSSPCLPFADCPNGTGYVQRVVRAMRDSGKTVTVLNLSVPGSVVGPEIENLARQLGRGSIGNFVERAAAVRVAQLDARDHLRRRQRRQRGRQRRSSRAWAAATRVGWGTAFATGFGRDLATIVDGVRARAPNARIILLNPPNGAGLPYVATRTRDQLRILQAISVRFSAEANVQASRGVLVVDLMCDPRSYLPSNYSSDGFHPNDAGYAFMAEAVLSAVNASSPAAAAQRLSADAPRRLNPATLPSAGLGEPHRPQHRLEEALVVVDSIFDRWPPCTRRH